MKESVHRSGRIMVGTKEEPETPPGDEEEIGRSFDGPAHTPARSLLKHFGRWVGDDIEECLDVVYRTRGKARF